MRATFPPATSPARKNGVSPHFYVTRNRSVLILGLAAVWSVWVLWHYYAPLVEAVAGADPFFDHPVLFDRWLRPFAHVGEALARSARAIAGAAAVALVATSLGRMLLSRKGPRFDDALEQFLFEIGIGFGTVSLLLLAIAMAHAYTPSVVASVIGALGLVSAVLVTRRGVTRWRADPLNWRASTRWSYAFATCAGLALVFALVAALAPETQYDALWYHLWLPQQWLAAGRPVDLVQEYISLYPLAWELLYGASLTIGGVIAAKLLHWLCLLLVACAAAVLIRLAFPRADRALVVALCVTAPTVLWEGTTAYADLPPAFFITLSVIAAWHYFAQGRRSWLALAGLTMGFALAIKHLSLVAGVIVGAAIIMGEWRRGASLRNVTGVAALFAGLALAPPMPWYVRAYAASGNPVFPDMYHVFGAHPPERWDDLSEEQLAAFKAHFGREGNTRSFTAKPSERSHRDREEPNQIRPPAASSGLEHSVRWVLGFAALPWNVTVHGARYAASFGPLFLILAPFAFAVPLQRRAALIIACGLAAFLAIWSSPISSLQGRFLVPIVPFLAVLAAAGAAALQDRAGRARHLISGTVVILLLINLPPFVRWHEVDRRGWDGWLTHVIRALPVAVVTGGESTEEYLERTIPSYRAWEFIDHTLPPDATVLTFSGGDHVYSRRRRIWSDATIARAVTWGTPAGREVEAHAAARALGIGYVLMDKRQDYLTRELAIGSDRMRACCLERMFEDRWFVVYRIRR